MILPRGYGLDGTIVLIDREAKLAFSRGSFSTNDCDCSHPSGALRAAAPQRDLHLSCGPVQLALNAAYPRRHKHPKVKARLASTGAFQGWSVREDDGSADVAAKCLGECLGGVGEAVAGGDRNLKLPVPESLREFAQLVSVRASRPPSATARIALDAPPRAALTAAATPWRPVIARTCSGHS